MKKNRARRRAGQRPDAADARAEWKAWQPSLDPAKLVFIDETGTATNMSRRRARCPRGERLVARVSQIAPLRRSCEVSG